MRCPKCGFDHPAQTVECRKCGVLFAKYVPSKRATKIPPFAAEAEMELEERHENRQEWVYRVFALPCSLAAAGLLVAIAPGAVRLLSMWVHETGHAVTAWLCGFSAVPGPWFTPVDNERSRAVTVVLAGLIGWLGFWAWQAERWFWLAGGAVVLTSLIVCTGVLYSDQAHQLIIFGGDAGCFVLGSSLMATFYASRGSVIYQNALRWGFLPIGAISFMDAFATWSGGIEKIPFGENENGMSDPSVLTELYGWSVKALMNRYYKLAVFCLIVLAIVYATGLANPLMSHNAARLRRAAESGRRT